MDKLIPVLQDTPLTTKAPESPSSWYKSETTVGIYTSSEAAWMHAQGWKTIGAVTVGGLTTYFMNRRIINPESVLQSLIESYTEAYNEGRALNDQRYDDLVVLHTSILDKTEDAYNAIEASDDSYEALVEALLTSIDSDFSTYSADVDGDLDSWGSGLLLEINARFDTELGKGQQSLVDRGLYSSTMWTTISAGIERERSRALSDAGDKIAQRQLELKHKVYSEQTTVRSKIVEARTRLRDVLRSSRDRQVVMRNAVADALAGLVERRTDGYPDLAQIGKLAASLGAGSAESYSP